MNERCIKCKAKDGDHLYSCPEVINTLRVQVEEMEESKYTGLLWIDEQDGSTNFKFNVAGGDFSSAREALSKFVAVIQDRLNNAEQCPFFESN